MSGLVWSRRAQNDLRGIVAYYAQFGPDIPERLIAAVDRAARQLIEHPRLGSELPDSEARSWLARATPFILIYRPTRDGVRILRVRHTASDWKPDR